MSNMKDKLAASVRQVKTSSPKPATAKPAAPATNPVTDSAGPAKSSPAAAPAARPQAAPPLASEPPVSGTALFPGRIWPD